MKLRVKIVILNLVIVVALGLLIGMAVRNLVAKTMKVELLKEGESMVRNLSNIIADYVLLHDRFKIEEALEDILKNERDIEYIFVTDTEGYIFVHTFKDGYPADLLQWNPITPRNISTKLLETEIGLIRDFGIKMFDGLEAELHIGMKQERITHTLIRVRNIVLTLTIFGLIIGLVLSSSLGRVITKPLYRLVDFSHSLSKGHFGRMVEINSKDEIGELANAFNNLSQELKLYLNPAITSEFS